MPLLILADDFTGALDTGVQISQYGIPTRLLISGDDDYSGIIANEDCFGEVVIIQTNIRHDPPVTAYLKIMNILSELAQNADLVYLKTDSALRGNLSAMFRALLDFFHERIYFVPALPKLNRTTRDGYQYIDGNLLEDSVFRKDLLNPMTTSFIPDILNMDYPVPCQLISEQDLHRFNPEEGLLEEGVILFDCISDSQMDSIYSKINQGQISRRTAGCAGFASTLHRSLPFQIKTNTKEKIFSKGPLLVISGSVNEINHAQLAYGKLSGFALVPIPIRELLPDRKETLVDHLVQQVKEAVDNHQSIILATSVSPGDIRRLANLSALEGLKGTILQQKIASCLQNITSEIFKRVCVETLVVFGGDTTAAVLAALNVETIWVDCEIQTGVPLSHFKWNGVMKNLVTKSGGMGSVDILTVVQNYFFQGE